MEYEADSSSEYRKLQESYCNSDKVGNGRKDKAGDEQMENRSQGMHSGMYQDKHSDEQTHREGELVDRVAEAEAINAEQMNKEIQKMKQMSETEALNARRNEGNQEMQEQEPPMTGIVQKVYEGEHYFHMVLKNSSSTKAATTVGADSIDDGEDNSRQREFRLIKTDLYLERAERERLALLNPESSLEQVQHNEKSQDLFMTRGEDSSSQMEFQNLLNAVGQNIDDDELEREARLRIQRDLAGEETRQDDIDPASIQLMKQSILLQRALDAFPQDVDNSIIDGPIISH